MPVDQMEFRRVLGHFAAGVTVVTTRGQDSRYYGLTATAFTSVSLVPPLVLVCIDKKADSFPHFETSEGFAVNLLTAEQHAVSEHFARSGGDKFSGLAFRTVVTGAPVLLNALGFLDCTMVHRYDGGDHRICVGQVEAADASAGHPLLYFKGAYRNIGDPLP